MSKQNGSTQPGFSILNGTPTLVIADQIFQPSGSGCSATLPDNEIRMIYSDDFSEEYINKYLNFYPEVSVPLFYSAMFAVVKCVLDYLNINIGFTTVVVGETASFKTVLAEHLCILDDNKGLITFGKAIDQGDKVQEVIEKISELSGVVFVLDDFTIQNKFTQYRKQKYNQILDSFVRESASNKKGAHLVVTAEKLPYDELNASLIDRMLIINVKKPSDDEVILMKKKIPMLSQHYLAAVVKVFAQKIVDSFEWCKGYIDNFISSYQCPDWIYDKSSRITEHVMAMQLTEGLFKHFFPKIEESVMLLDILEKDVKNQVNVIRKILYQENGAGVFEVLNEVADSRFKGDEVIAIYTDNEAIKKDDGCKCWAYRREAVPRELWISGNNLMRLLNCKLCYEVKKGEVISKLENYGLLREEGGSAKTIQGLGTKNRYYVIRIGELEKTCKNLLR